MVPLCTFIHPNGKTCASPSLRTRDYCYFHNPSRRVSGPRQPTRRTGYRWYLLYRKIPTLRREQVIPLQTELVTAVSEHQIPREIFFKIMPRFNRRIVELGNELRRQEASSVPDRKQSRNSQNI
ncbi:MAG TPA: hypothetical protein VHT28_06265 [Silvibacterium sp.]|nr:hypothetical protein [Silvibacterium sp.]